MPKSPPMEPDRWAAAPAAEKEAEDSSRALDPGASALYSIILLALLTWLLLDVTYSGAVNPCCGGSGSRFCGAPPASGRPWFFRFP